PSVSRSTFYRRFKEETGSPPARMLRAARLKEAARLLRESRVGIAEIARNCGFSSANYFSQVFRREFDVTPKEYRESKS
ncbi:MAG: helix-turn-helix transcriptional regulator, partial [Kiritimatiellia bacterium]